MCLEVSGVCEGVWCEVPGVSAASVKKQLMELLGEIDQWHKFTFIQQLYNLSFLNCIAHTDMQMQQ